MSSIQDMDADMADKASGEIALIALAPISELETPLHVIYKSLDDIPPFTLLLLFRSDFQDLESITETMTECVQILGYTNVNGKTTCFPTSWQAHVSPPRQP